MLVVMPSHWAIEVEIKVSFSDIKADLHKRHTHWHKLIRQTYFAIPKDLADRPEVLAAIPEKFGVLAVDDMDYTTCVRAATINPQAVKLSDKQYAQVMRLATIRVWSLTRKNLELKNCLDDTYARLKELQEWKSTHTAEKTTNEISNDVKKNILNASAIST